MGKLPRMISDPGQRKTGHEKAPRNQDGDEYEILPISALVLVPRHAVGPAAYSWVNGGRPARFRRELGENWANAAVTI